MSRHPPNGAAKPGPQASAAALDAEASEPLLSREWLVTNGLGGYASGTVGGVITRGFHGYLVAALPSPLGRMMMLNELVEQIELPGGRVIQLGGEERASNPVRWHGADYLKEFRLSEGLPAWRYRGGRLRDRETLDAARTCRTPSISPTACWTATAS